MNEVILTPVVRPGHLLHLQGPVLFPRPIQILVSTSLLKEFVLKFNGDIDESISKAATLK